MTDEERERLRAIRDAADELSEIAHWLRCGSLGYTPADIEAAWDRLLALRWPDRQDLEDLIEEAISDSLEMDWRPRDGARSVIRALLPPPVKD